MTISAAFVAGLFGLIVGSFLTVVVFRVPRHESLVKPRSRCPGCGKQIRAGDNIPVVSFLIRRGRCRDCGAKISIRYPLTEAANALLWVLAVLRFPADLGTALLFAVFFSTLLAIALIDAETRLIPNAIVYPAVPAFAVALVLLELTGSPVDLAWAGLGALCFGGTLILVSLAAPRAMGMGDGKLAVLIGLVTGSLGGRFVLVSAVAGFFVGGIGGVVALALGRDRKSALPFGPYLALGAVLAVLIGGSLASWYAGLLGG